MRTPEPCLCGAEDCPRCYPQRFKRAFGRLVPVGTDEDDVLDALQEDEE